MPVTETAPEPAAAPASAPAAASASPPASAPPAAMRVPLNRADAPVEVQADRIGGRPDVEVEAEGNVDVRKADVRVQADRAHFRQDQQLLTARGHVRIEQAGNRVTGPELQLQLDTREGFMREPEYFIALTQAGGQAERFEFLGPDRARIVGGTYTSCGTDGSGTPAWLLSAERVDLDFEAKEGVARGGVLRFMGVPILAAPWLSFPLSDERKSGWLPPSINIDSRSGLDLALPYYWNIAPNRDATLTPTVSVRRGLGLNSEFRYLEPTYQGRLNFNFLPDDRVAGRSRYALGFDHAGRSVDFDYRAVGVRVSDDDYWKDFSRGTTALLDTRTSATVTQRLLPADFRAERSLGSFGFSDAAWTGYARALSWQVLQSPDAPIVPPYERLPQIGVQGGAALAGGLRVDLQTEFNRFSPAPTAVPDLIAGTRWHALGTLSRPWTTSWGWFTPKLSVNAASYSTDRPMADGRSSASRVIPTLSADTGLVFERASKLFGRELRQTLEPRLLYVRTPYRNQDALPLFDTAGKDFNITSLYTENAFSGVDRVSDANQLTAGVTSRFLEEASGQELARFAVAQRVLFNDQRITPEGEPITQRLSDLLLLGSSVLAPNWGLDGTIQYNHQTRRVSRSVLGVNYSPGPYRTLSARYRFTRGFVGEQLVSQQAAANEQLELGWQWPVYGPAPGALIRGSGGGGTCKGSLYGVGRVVYNLRDSRITDSIAGFEYDAGCWIARVVGERVSTGRAEATTRLMLQLELVGLSRLGSNPLQLLKDNVPGYRLLREEVRSPPPPVSYE
ncbi:LPS-assembly protein LptD [Azohydromonas sp. G-1-1-14]|uniref:LPS-assembly protein LptD n=2 Tax=Azohydromonas caseinilytica TaxID=2728836 RepID=A0A848FDQ8_9BURK|nr:LPS-assembly protein LptD [Azohydromonas caseinilytica]